MIELSPGRFMVGRLDELPNFLNSKELFVDAETSLMGNLRELKPDGTTKPRKMAVEPHLGDRVCGWAITADDCKDSFYVPIRHTAPGSNNLDVGAVSAWMQDTIQSADSWINANVKFDAHFADADGISFGDTKLVCTTTLAKTIDSDRFSHKHKELCRDWLGLKMEEEDEIKQLLASLGSHDYGRVAPDRMGWYACGDVESNRILWKYLRAKRPREMAQLWETEIALTPVLFDMEKEGLRVDVRACKQESVNALTAMINSSQRIQDHTDIVFTGSSTDIHDILCEKLQLPVLSWNKDDNGNVTGPCFDKDALKLYENLPAVNSSAVNREILELILEYRGQQHFRSLFADNFVRKIDEFGLLHSSYNQTVRTGRMSCRNPNSQQMSPRAKLLIIPDAGCSFLNLDASQLEFRIIVHYINDKAAIAAYLNDKNTDFHQWVAELCEIPRKPAKNINFAKAFGAGMTRISNMLAGQDVVLLPVVEQVEQEIKENRLSQRNRVDRIAQLCYARAKQIYNTYNARLPNMPRKSKEAAILCEQRGWIRNRHKRRRHLPAKQAHNAFNSMVQGEAMDLIKERMVAVAPRYNREVRELGITIKANVHDALLFHGETETMSAPPTMKLLKDILEDPALPYKVPILWDGGTSSENWKKAE